MSAATSSTTSNRHIDHLSREFGDGRIGDRPAQVVRERFRLHRSAGCPDLRSHGTTRRLSCLTTSDSPPTNPAQPTPYRSTTGLRTPSPGSPATLRDRVARPPRHRRHQRAAGHRRRCVHVGHRPPVGRGRARRIVRSHTARRVRPPRLLPDVRRLLSPRLAPWQRAVVRSLLVRSYAPVGAGRAADRAPFGRALAALDGPPQPGDRSCSPTDRRSAARVTRPTASSLRGHLHAPLPRPRARLPSRSACHACPSSIHLTRRRGLAAPFGPPTRRRRRRSRGGRRREPGWRPADR